MKTVSCLLVAGALASIAVAQPAPDHDFNGVVDGLEQHYGISGHRLPMMGLAGFCARLATHGGVKGLRIAEFEHLGSNPIDADDMSRFIGERLGSEWRPVIKEREQHGKEQTAIFVRPSGNAMRMLIAEYENGELNVVRVELDGQQLSQWMRKMDDPTKHLRGDGHDDHASVAGSEAQ